MKKLWFLLLAVCLIGFLAGCDGGGGGSDDDNGGSNGGGNGGSPLYIVTDLTDMTGVTNFSIIEGGIQFDMGGHTYQNYVSLTDDGSDGTFALHERELEDGVVQADCTFHGTYEIAGSTLNVHCTKTTYANGDPDNLAPWDDTFTIVNDTVMHIWGWVMTRQ